VGNSILITGKGQGGSWQIRGEQLGRAIGARVKPNANIDDVSEAGITVCVKRISTALEGVLRNSGRPWVWDLVDCWPQPAGNRWSREDAIEHIRTRLDYLRPTAVVYATTRMAWDIGYPGIVVYHHGHPGYMRNPIRKAVERVGYEGDTRYLGRWESILRAECCVRGWEFVTNPGFYASMDIVVAFRDGAFDGYAPKSWKSNVKLANAQITGTPFVASPECGYSETDSGAEFWATDRAVLGKAFDHLADYNLRREASQIMLESAPHLDEIATGYREWLSGLSSS